VILHQPPGGGGNVSNTGESQRAIWGILELPGKRSNGWASCAQGGDKSWGPKCANGSRGSGAEIKKSSEPITQDSEKERAKTERFRPLIVEV